MSPAQPPARRRTPWLLLGAMFGLVPGITAGMWTPATAAGGLPASAVSWVPPAPPDLSGLEIVGAPPEVARAELRDAAFVSTPGGRTWGAQARLTTGALDDVLPPSEPSPYWISLAGPDLPAMAGATAAPHPVPGPRNDAAAVGADGAAALPVATRDVAVPWVTTPRGEPVWIRYALDPAVGEVSARDLSALPEWAYAVRLLLSESGSHRLAQARWGILEALGILETVDNRLDPAAWNPAGVRGASAWPGCRRTPSASTSPEAAAAAFKTCANPGQYFGLKQRRALAPREAVPEARLLPAVDVAVAAWWLRREGLVAGVAGGATSFVHRCGGAAYGASTARCDGKPAPDGTPDPAGAERRSGPIVFFGPSRFDRSRGRYLMTTLAAVDYVQDAPQDRDAEAPAGAIPPWDAAPPWHEVAAVLQHLDAEAPPTFTPPTLRLGDDGVHVPASEDAIVEALPPGDLGEG